jgi:hypothetical protein
MRAVGVSCNEVGSDAHHDDCADEMDHIVQTDRGTGDAVLTRRGCAVVGRRGLSGGGHCC